MHTIIFSSLLLIKSVKFLLSSYQFHHRMSFSRFNATFSDSVTIIAVGTTMFHIRAAGGISVKTTTGLCTADRAARVVYWARWISRTDISFACFGICFCCSQLQEFGGIDKGIAVLVTKLSTFVTTYTASCSTSATVSILGTTTMPTIFWWTACFRSFTRTMIWTNSVFHFGTALGLQFRRRFQGR